MPHRPLCSLAVALGLAATAGSAFAQNAGADRRFERIERDLKTLQTVVMQAQATGQPVVVKPEGPDPALTALQTRAEDLEATLQRVNGQVETLGHDVESLRAAETAAETQRRAQLQTLNDRLARIETQLTALAQSQSAADPTLAAGSETPPAPIPDGGGPPRRAGADATGRAQAQDTGVLGAAPAAPTAAEAFIHARDLFTTGDQAGAANAFQDFLSRYPTNARAPEAYYWLGESYYAQKGWQNATAAYASALKSRPTTPWAPAAMVRLAQALAQSNQTAQACAALTEYDQRYAAKAPAAVKTNANALRKRAGCG
jgi:tol-pal system protein YbgF